MATFLPEDLVIFDILPRLPVKSLMRFKCVSKNWMTCISADRLLIDAHRRLQQQSALVLYITYINYRELLIARPDLYPEDHEFPLPPQKITVCSEQFLKAKEVDLSYLIEEYGPIKISTSCKGLLCLTFDDFRERVVLWNPATRQRRHLSSPTDSSRLWSAGIGLDEVSGDWKVVRLCLESDDPSTIHPEEASLVRAHVLAESSTGWRDGGVSGIKGVFWYRGMTPVAAAGALHWHFYPTHIDEREDMGILSFDLTDEVFRFAYGPEDYFELCNWKSSLATLTHKVGSSTLTVASPSSSSNRMSWTKLVKFNHNVFYVWREHYLLYEHSRIRRSSSTLLLVDPKAPGEMISLKQHIRAQSGDFRIYDYVESLTSVF